MIPSLVPEKRYHQSLYVREIAHIYNCDLEEEEHAS